MTFEFSYSRAVERMVYQWSLEGPRVCDVFKLFTLLSHLHKALVIVFNLLCTLLREVAALALNYNVRNSISVAFLFPNGHPGVHHAFITILNECLRLILRDARCSGRLE